VVVAETFQSVADAKTLVDGGHLAASFRSFWQAAQDAQ